MFSKYKTNFLCSLLILILLLTSIAITSFAESQTESPFIIEYYRNIPQDEVDIRNIPPEAQNQKIKPYYTQIMEPGKKHILKDEFPSVDYINFVGWSTDKNATEAEYLPGEVFTGDSSTVLYAIWTDPYDLGEIAESCTIEQESPAGTGAVWFTFTVPEEAYYHFYTTNKIKNIGASSTTGIYYREKPIKPENGNLGFWCDELVRDTDFTKPDIDLLGRLSPDNIYYLSIWIPKGKTLVLECEIIGK